METKHVSWRVWLYTPILGMDRACILLFCAVLKELYIISSSVTPIEVMFILFVLFVRVGVLSLTSSYYMMVGYMMRLSIVSKFPTIGTSKIKE